MRNTIVSLVILVWGISMLFGETVAVTDQENIPDTIFDLEDLTQLPVQDPATLKVVDWPIDGKIELTGVVVVRFVVTKKGNTQCLKVEKSTDDRLSEIAITNVEQWKFKPGYIDDDPVSCRIIVRIPFEYK